ncbi:MAG: ornithine carbamoyltransferase [Planctomycetota bacterium]|nr:ornithine carbamoyltransferase [Planctomycetaceae bacterium]MDQ3330762.1 ornithine carbamoyltransferase [Planctomycetota bacterium]
MTSSATPKPPRHLLTLDDWTADEIEQVLALARDLKRKAKFGERPPLLAGKMLAQVYDKPSLRTRVSFEAAMARLGGSSTFMTSKEAGLLGRESLPDVAAVLGRMVDAIVIRTFSQQLIEDVAAYAACPVINGLSDERHPCQALADLLTIREACGTLDGVRLVFVGDGNNVARSLAVASGKVGVAMTLCAPDGFSFDDTFAKGLKKTVPQLNITLTKDLKAAIKNADIIYTDVWASMGQESESSARKQAFAAYQITEQIMAAAPQSCRFLHCLPAHRGDEVTDGVMDGPQSLVYEQAENRMHLAKGLLVTLIG